ncbi:heme acquisition protein HasA [Yersinia vastinensis]|uniref:heme acquisition protein HasA n=1 Tax=Yersinia vastinensis TaxID=2890318 RepID=UPI0005DDCB13|nr:heme acquisition protein HasA [Yersinia vastinensis]OVZ96606.1 preprotein translocase subunit SecG [Yersinia frederiksenii]CNJ20881.1 Preprotein translocase subunit SecG [Yersinia frederiksenii]
MAVEIWYQAKIENETLSSYTRKWAADFGNMMSSHTIDDDYMFQTGTYSSNSGNLYAFGRVNQPQNNVALSAGYRAVIQDINGDIFDQQVVTGISGSLEFGESIIPIADVELLDECLNGDEVYFQIDDVQLDISGLDSAGDTESSLNMLLHLSRHRDCPDGQSLGVYGLLRGDAEPILAKFKAQGIDVDTPLKDMAIANQFYTANDDVMVESAVIETVGVIEGNEVLSVA